MKFPLLRALLFAALPLTPAFAQDDGATSALTVTLSTPETRSWPIEVTASGWLAAWQEAVISSEVGSQKIIAVNADVGDMVHEGDVLVELSQETILNDIEQQKATVDSEEASLEQATSDADRARRLNGSGSISQQQVTEYLVTERQAKADLASARAQLASSQLDLERTRITAISTGTITSRDAALGDVVASGDEMFRMIRDNRIEWQAEVPVRDVFKLTEGTRASLPGPQGTITGTVRRIAPEASESNGRIIVYVALDPPEDAPAPRINVMVSGTFHVGESDAMTLPATAVVMSDGFSYVYVLQDDSTVLRQRVTTGRRLDDAVEITDGLDGSERIVTSGGAFLSDGATVTVVEASQ